MGAPIHEDGDLTAQSVTVQQASQGHSIAGIDAPEQVLGLGATRGYRYQALSVAHAFNDVRLSPGLFGGIVAWRPRHRARS